MHFLMLLWELAAPSWQTIPLFLYYGAFLVSKFQLSSLQMFSKSAVSTTPKIALGLPFDMVIFVCLFVCLLFL